MVAEDDVEEEEKTVEEGEVAVALATLGAGVVLESPFG